MNKCLVIFLFLLPVNFGFSGKNYPGAISEPNPKSEIACSCPAVSNIQITAQGTNYITFSWTGAFGATQYKLWYYRVDDDYTSSSYFTSNTYYTYGNLTAGRYVFYFQSICGGESSLISTMDVVMN